MGYGYDARDEREQKLLVLDYAEDQTVCNVNLSKLATQLIAWKWNIEIVNTNSFIGEECTSQQRTVIGAIRVRARGTQ